MRLLIVRLSALGDIVHALPVAESARRAGATVGWLCEDRYRDLLEGNPNVDRLFFADTRGWRRDPVGSRTRHGYLRLRSQLRAFAPDRTIDAQGLWKSSILARLAGAPVAGFAASERREGASALLCTLSVRPPPEARHVVDRNLALLSAVGIPVSDRRPDATYLLSRDDSEAAAFLASQPRPFAVYHPGAGRADKVWGEEKLALVARRVEERAGRHVVLSWGPGDEVRVEKMASSLPRARCVPLLPPHGLAHVIAAADIFVGGDTGPLHLADSLGVATLALFGPTDPQRNGPYRGRAMRYDHSTTSEGVSEIVLEVLGRDPGAPPAGSGEERRQSTTL